MIDINTINVGDKVKLISYSGPIDHVEEYGFRLGEVYEVVRLYPEDRLVSLRSPTGGEVFYQDELDYVFSYTADQWTID